MKKIFGFIILIMFLLISNYSFAALSAVKTFTDGYSLTAAELNALNTNILNNANSLISPFTGNIDAGGYNISSVGTLTVTTGTITTGTITTLNTTTGTITTLTVTTPYIPIPGYASRNADGITYSDGDTVTISGNYIEVDGKVCWWDADITFDLGSGGSNSSSDNLGADEWHYIYIDYSTVTSGTELTAANFLNDTTAPGERSTSKRGFYNGSDRAIGAVLTGAGSTILDFLWKHGYYAHSANNISELSNGSATNFTDVDLTSSVPDFGATTVQILCTAAGTDADDQELTYYLQTNNDSNDTLFTNQFDAAGATARTGILTITTEIMTDTSQVIEYQIVQGSTQTLDIDVTGFWLFI